MPPPKIASVQDTGFIGVPDDYSISRPPTLGDTFRPGGMAYSPSGSGLDHALVPSGAPIVSTPLYETDGPNTAAAIAAIASLPPEQLARLQIKLARAGLISKSSTVQVGIFDDVTENAYTEVLGIANRYGISDMEALAKLESQPSLTGELLGTARAGKGGGLSLPKPKPTTSTSTSTSTEHFTRLDAEAAADAAFQEALGEDADPKYARALKKALNAYAKANPSKSTSTTVTGVDGNSRTTTSSSGGITAAGAQQIAQNMARQAPNYGEVQAATVYMDALSQAFDSPVDL